jgi:hypothetical protein
MKTLADIDRGDDAAAQIEQPGNRARRKRYRRQLLTPQDIAHLQDRHAKFPRADLDGDVVTHAALRSAAGSFAPAIWM